MSETADVIDDNFLPNALCEIITQQDVSGLAYVVLGVVKKLVKADFIALLNRGLDVYPKYYYGLTIVGDGVDFHKSGIHYSESPRVFDYYGDSRWVSGLAAVRLDSPELADLLEQNGARSCCTVKLDVNNIQTGVLIICRGIDRIFSEKDLFFIEKISTHIAVSLERMARVEESCRKKLLIERDNKRRLMVHKVSDAIVSELNLRKLVHKISASIKTIIGIEYTDLLLYDAVNDLMIREAVGSNGRSLMVEGFNEQMCNSPAHVAFKKKKTIICGRVQLAEHAKETEAIRLLLADGFQEYCCIPLIIQERALGVLNLLSSQVRTFTPDCVSLLVEIAKPIAVAVDNALAYRAISEMKNKLARENEYLEEQISVNSKFDEIVGNSDSIKKVLSEIETVACSDANVLVTGETGTGKELIARALHRLSGRNDANFVKLNCAAIPSELLESELFGHERGAFTGAVAARMGLMELAQGGTLFLDEVGDIPLNLQPKLLRVLQERQLSRVGSSRTIDVDFRLIAATNRDLGQMVSDHEFRSDLYYRLNVFPITAPPLRERCDDIPLLVRHFVQKYTRNRKIKIESIPDEAMSALQNWGWPGNIRELENFIERSVILSRGTILNIPVADIRKAPASFPILSHVSEPMPVSCEDDGLSPEEQNHREAILRALKESGGTVAGPQGAAARLGMKRTTLLWKMQRLGIKARREFL